jgi:hypothetical protein
MVESVLYFVLGVFVMGVLALFVAQAIWHRAVRLTTRRLLRHVPVSAADVTAVADLARAEHAVLVNRLERKSHVLTRRIAEQMAELGRHVATIQRLHSLLAERQSEVGQRDAREHVLESDLLAVHNALAKVQADLAATYHQLENSQKAYSVAEAQRRELEMHTNSQNIALASAQAAMAALNSRVSEIQAELDNARDDMKHEIEARVKAQQAVAGAYTKAREEVSIELSTLEGQIERLKIEKAMLDGALSSARARGAKSVIVSADENSSQFTSSALDALPLPVPQRSAVGIKSDAARVLRNRSAARIARRSTQPHDALLPEVADKR